MKSAPVSTGRRGSLRRGNHAVNDRFGIDESLATQETSRYHGLMPVVTPKTALRGFDINFFDVIHAGETYRVQIKRVATARRFTLRVRAATRDVVLTLPPRGSLTRAKVFVERHADWVKSRLARLPVPTPFGPGALIPLRGSLHEISHRPGARGTVWIEQPEFDAAGHPKLCVSGEAPFVARRVQDFLMREAKRDLHAAVERHTKTIGTAARRISLRDTTSRWGSCSSAGSLNFSWRLIMAPPFVLDYLAAHEVAHLVHMNHSADFWMLAHRLAPELERAEAWLKVHGVGLMRFGTSGAEATA
jgi:predicted metal-dependent hydrolase